jgi:hypothetical protein
MPCMLAGTAVTAVEVSGDEVDSHANSKDAELQSEMPLRR